MSTNLTKDYGFTAVPASASTVKKSSTPSTTPPPAVLSSTTPAPSTPLAARIQAFAKQELIPQTYHHSMRVYHYGLAMARANFPQWGFTPGSTLEETYFLTCMLHDIGTTDKFMEETMMSFEFHGAWVAYQELVRSQDEKAKAPTSQAESVAEAIIRHQDICEEGKITLVGQLIQLSTTFDNMGMHPELVNEETIKDVVKAWPRMGWSGCFSKTVRKENGLKPWCHSTALGEDAFPDGVANNKLMAPYDG